jgi:metal-sulfur cluster biosynthetic enzyme
MTAGRVDRIRAALRSVIDPELGYNVVDLGFVYGIAAAEGGVVTITMTTTTPGCPATSFLRQGVASAASRVDGVESVDVRLTFDPEWKPDMMSQQARADLGFAETH